MLVVCLWVWIWDYDCETDSEVGRTRNDWKKRRIAKEEKKKSLVGKFVVATDKEIGRKI